MKQKELEIRLQRIPPHPAPRVVDEQYETPAPVAAEILYLALGFGDIAGRRVADLGCGTGILAIGAALLGAQEVVGIDRDEVAVQIGDRMARDFGVQVDFIAGEVGEAGTVTHGIDTVVMNPPFGAQLANRHADIGFLEHALRMAPIVYSLHRTPTDAFVTRAAKSLRATVSLRRRYALTLRATQPFHERERHAVDVTLYRFVRESTAPGTAPDHDSPGPTPGPARTRRRRRA